ncbi:MAG TPA: hypothetical protein VJ858_04165 [Acidimicrobiia bacterium]|nr:hypothetical protein [Acidimicrobiia bacterium]
MDQITSRLPETGVESTPESEAAARRAFSMAIVISGIRCVIAYILLPFVAPLLGLAPGVGPWLGIAISVVAIVANVFSIRRFARSRHRLRRLVIGINVTVIAFMVVLIGMDLSQIVTV